MKSKRFKKYLVLLFVFLAIGVLIAYNEIFIKGANMNEDRIISSPNFKNGKFHNYEEIAVIDENNNDSMAKILLDMFVLGEKPKSIPSVKNNLKSLGDDDYLVWFGHSSYLLQIDNTKILVDPVFGRASPIPLINNPFNGTDIYSTNDLPSTIDYLIITHNHYDHLSKDDIKALKDKVNIAITPLGVGKYLRNWGFKTDNIIELDWDEEYTPKDDFKIFCLTARHFSGRKLLDNNTTLWASYLLKIKDKQVYIGGDSGYGKHFKDIGDRFGKIDLAFLENGQYDKNWKDVHMFPQDVLNAANDLNVSVLFPVHNSKFKISRHIWNDPLNEIFNLNSLNNDKLELMMPMIGEMVPLWENHSYTKWWE